jgi:gliding motility-associated protein GldL
MKYLYGIGAAVVIAGALFKIMHWPYANEMLIAGMGTEVLIFFVSAFEPLHEELDWARVYPQLAEEPVDEEFLLDDGGEELTPEEALAIAESGMKDVQITPELFQSLSGSITGLQDNVSKLANIEDASLATNDYARSVREATNKMTDLSANYDTTVDAMSNLASSVGGAADNARLYQEQVQAVTKNLSSLNAVYEMELQDAQQHLKSLNQFYGSMANAMENMVDASRDAEQYRTEVASLTKNISALNKVYGGMLSAMNTGNA